MNASQVIANYKLLSMLTEQMLEAAMDEEWNQLICIEQQCGELVSAMKPIDAEAMLDEASLQHKNQLINKILTDEDKIRFRVQDWMRQLKLNIQSNRQEQRLLHAYGA